MKIKDIALKEVKCASPDNSMQEIASMMRDYGVGAIPICEGDKLVGMITDRDIVITCLATGNDVKACKASDFMTKSPRSVSPDQDVADAADIMAEEQVRRLPVVKGDKLVGIISLGDISRSAGGDFKLLAETLRKISTPTHSSKSH